MFSVNSVICGVESTKPTPENIILSASLKFKPKNSPDPYKNLARDIFFVSTRSYNELFKMSKNITLSTKTLEPKNPSKQNLACLT